MRLPSPVVACQAPGCSVHRHWNRQVVQVASGHPPHTAQWRESTHKGWGPVDSDPTSYIEAAPFLGRTFFPTPPALDSFRAGAFSLLLRAEWVWLHLWPAVLVTSASWFTQESTGNEEQVVLAPHRFLADTTGLCCLAEVLALLWESAGEWHWPHCPCSQGLHITLPTPASWAVMPRQRGPMLPVPSRNLGQWQLCL